jgi:hypothetical protein
MAEMGRPRKEIDWNEFEKLCKLQCTLDEICGWFGVCDETLNARCKEHYGETFSVIFKQKRGSGKASLRRTLWKQAEKSPAAAIWLSKQHLGMTDKIEQNTTAEIKINVDSDDQHL